MTVLGDATFAELQGCQQLGSPTIIPSDGMTWVSWGDTCYVRYGQCVIQLRPSIRVGFLSSALDARDTQPRIDWQD